MVIVLTLIQWGEIRMVGVNEKPDKIHTSGECSNSCYTLVESGSHESRLSSSNRMRKEKIVEDY